MPKVSKKALERRRQQAKRKMKKYQELLEAAKEGRISWREFWDRFNRNIAIRGTGPIVQKMIEEKWRLWDEAIKGTSPIVQKMIEEKWRSWDEAKKRKGW